jgi:translation elongation factor EF-1alpha
MITGAAQANCGILVLDSRIGAFEDGFMAFRGTTCEHATLAKSLGVSQLICAINKLET